MPDVDFHALTQDDIERLAHYTPGYDWIPGKFGPPPGIPKAKMERLDVLSDRDYMSTVMRMGIEERESLMIAEKHRLRTFSSLWEYGIPIKPKDIARNGFYYTGVSDRVQCAFCGGFLGNWELGDDPRQLHKTFFAYCHMARGIPCANIPISLNGADSQLSQLISNGHLDEKDMVITNSPTHPKYKIMSIREGTYNSFPMVDYFNTRSFSTAGFYFTGKNDTVTCFWCGGSLNDWTKSDDPWDFHARFFPECAYLIQCKGIQYIKSCRQAMTKEDRKLSEEVEYNKSGVKENLSEIVDIPIQKDGESYDDDPHHLQIFDSFQVCKSLGFSQKELEDVFTMNNNKDFSSIQILIDLLLSNRNHDRSSMDIILQSEGYANMKIVDINPSKSHETQWGKLHTDDYIGMDEDLNLEQSVELIIALTCVKCENSQVQITFLPCGHFITCEKCFKTHLPEKCYFCKGTVRAGLRTHLG